MPVGIYLYFFHFVPVNCLSKKIIIPSEKSQLLINCSLKCGNHGKCFQDNITCPQ